MRGGDLVEKIGKRITHSIAAGQLSSTRLRSSSSQKKRKLELEARSSLKEEKKGGFGNPKGGRWGRKRERKEGQSTSA